jgi:DNA-directed RNA polymerase specialized sigma24 family protein
VSRVETTDAESPALMQKRAEWLHEQLAGMDAADVEVLILRHRFGWTLARIGQALGLGHGAVDRRLRRIVRALKDRAKEETNGLSTF